MSIEEKQPSMAVEKQLPKTHPFQLNQRVEIKTFEIGYEGSWHIATVVLSDERCFHIKYDHVLFLEDGPERIVEVLPSFSTRLRPLPPPAPSSLLGFTYGLCVDLWKDNAWWEAVVADHLNHSDQRIVFLLDSCREIRAGIHNLRVTQDWDSSTGIWRRRGNWPLIQWIGLGVNGPSLLPDQDSGIEKLGIESDERQAIETTPFSHNAAADDESGKGTTKKKRRSWQTVGSDILPGPEFCPRFVTEYATFGSDKRPPECVVMGVRKHLAALGWKIEYKKEKAAFRFRYISPNETLTYFSLRLLCQDLREPVLVNCKTPERNKRNRKPDTNSETPTKRSKIPDEESPSSDSKLEWAPSPDSVLKPPRVSVSTRSQQRKRTFLFPDDDCGVGSTTESVRIRLKAANCSKRKACFLLSTLIDSNMLLLDAQVSCHNKNIVKRGILKREGIHCQCCNKCYSLTGFESHTGSKKHRPAASIFLEDGKSLSECYGKILNKRRKLTRKRKKSEELEEDGDKDPNDLICSVCREVGDLLCCDSCPSSFHYTCVGLEKLPDGDWFCPFCCCDICRQVSSEDGNSQLLSCDHCELKFHGGCLRKKGQLSSKSQKRNWFCSVECGTMFSGLEDLVGKPISVGDDDLTWTLLRSVEESWESDSETRAKLNSAIDVLHECFEPFKDDFSGTDIVDDLTYSKRSDLKRLNFLRFYTIVIERGGEVMSAANVRILGEKLAEMPIVGTRFQYRGQGLCRVLVNVLEKQLKRFGVERLVLPAAHSVLDIWKDNFGFTELGSQDRKLIGSRFMEFEGTVTCHKLLQ
ncbi:Increased DNA methylation 1 [Linum perenne]